MTSPRAPGQEGVQVGAAPWRGLAENPLDTLHALPSQQEAEQVAEHVVHLPAPHLPAHGHADHVHVHVANESSHLSYFDMIHFHPSLPY